jgi:hypothetical protein
VLVIADRYAASYELPAAALSAHPSRLRGIVARRRGTGRVETPWGAPVSQSDRGSLEWSYDFG